MVSKRRETPVRWLTGSNLSWVQLICWVYPLLWLSQSSGMAFNSLGQLSYPEPRWFLEDLSNPILHDSVQEDLCQSRTLLCSPFNQQMIQIFQGLLWPFFSGFRYMHFQLLTSALCFPKWQLLKEGEGLNSPYILALCYSSFMLYWLSRNLLV